MEEKKEINWIHVCADFQKQGPQWNLVFKPLTPLNIQTPEYGIQGPMWVSGTPPKDLHSPTQFQRHPQAFSPSCFPVCLGNVAYSGFRVSSNATSANPSLVSSHSLLYAPSRPCRVFHLSTHHVQGLSQCTVSS